MLHAISLATVLAGTSACSDKVEVKIKVRVADAGVAAVSTSTVAPAAKSAPGDPRAP
ncbi:hypothetical protein L6R52_29495 [Myxococcota bacterium]|nr:hypothetical protein [Myxococcota bacterium]